MLLVFNEIIEINIFGFQKNTRKRISERAELDLLNINENCEDNEYIAVNDAYIVDF